MSDSRPPKPSLASLYAPRAKPRTATIWQVATEGLDLQRSNDAREIDQLFLTHPDEMNDQTFGSGAWSRIEESDRDRLLPGRSSHPDRWDQATWIRVELAFYPGTLLWQFHWSDSGQLLWLLSAPDQTLVLDGTEETLREANRRFSLTLTPENAAGYLKYFATTTPMNEFLGWPVESSTHPLCCRLWAHRITVPELRSLFFPPLQRSNLDGIIFHFEVSELFNGECVHTRYRVYPSGTVEREGETFQDPIAVAEAELDRAVELREHEQSAEAVQTFSNCIRILEAIEADGALVRPRTLAKALLFRAFATRAQGLSSPLVPDMDKAIALFKSQPKLDAPDEDLAACYYLRARGRHALGDGPGAMADYWHFDDAKIAGPTAWDPFHADLPAMNERTFGKKTWEPDQERINRDLPAFLCRIRLPFYPKAVFWQAVPRIDQPFHRTLWLLEQDQTLLHFEGQSDPVFEANDALGLVLSDQTVVPYLKFFCTLVEGDEGPFYIVEERQHPVVVHHEGVLGPKVEAILPAIILGQTEGTWRVSATVLYGVTLFRATFLVALAGSVTMADDQPL